MNGARLPRGRRPRRLELCYACRHFVDGRLAACAHCGTDLLDATMAEIRAQHASLGISSPDSAENGRLADAASAVVRRSDE